MNGQQDDGVPANALPPQPPPPQPQVQPTFINIQQNVRSAYDPALPRPHQVVHAPVIVLGTKSGNIHCCLVVCMFLLFPVVFFTVAFAITSEDPYSFENGGPLDHTANICAGRMNYTATGWGTLTSDRYNNGNYPPNLHCVNRIVSASNGITFEINAFHTEDDNDEVIFTISQNEFRNYYFDGDHTSYKGPQVGDRFSFSDSYVDITFLSDSSIEFPGFSFTVVDGYEPINDVDTKDIATRISNINDIPKKKSKKTE